MNILRRKSSSSKKGGADTGVSSDLLADVQACCSTSLQKGLEPDDHTMSRAIAQLQQTLDSAEMEKVIKFLGGNLKSESHRVVMLTLATIGFLMRSNHAEFQQCLSRSPQHVLKPMTVLVEYRRKAGAKTDQHEQADKALALIQCWGEALRGKNDTGEIYECYKSLQQKEWVRWPPRNYRFDPPPTGGYSRDGVSLDPEAPPPPRKPASLRPSSLRTFSSEDRSWMRKDFDQFDQMLTTMESELAGVKDSRQLEENVLIPELVLACDKIGPQLRSMIEIVSLSSQDDPDALNPLLEMNDRLLRLIARHQQLQQKEPTEAVFVDQSVTPPMHFTPAPPPQRQRPQPIVLRVATASNAAYNPFDDENIMKEVFGTPPQPQLRPAPPVRAPPAPGYNAFVTTTTTNTYHDEFDLL